MVERHPPFIEVEAGPEGSVAADVPVVGTHLHGLLEQPAPRHALVHALAATRGFTWHPGAAQALDPFDALADVVEATVRLDGLRASSLVPLTTGVHQS
jgi:cobyric acid synthase